MVRIVHMVAFRFRKTWVSIQKLSAPGFCGPVPFGSLLAYSLYACPLCGIISKGFVTSHFLFFCSLSHGFLYYPLTFTLTSIQITPKVYISSTNLLAHFQTHTLNRILKIITWLSHCYLMSACPKLQP